MRGKRALSAAGLALVALAGFGLGACGGGGGGALGTSGTLNLTSIAGTVSPSTPTRTRTRTATVDAPTDAATTSATTTAGATTTTAVTTTVGETTTTAVTTTVSGPTTTTTHIFTATTATTTVPVTVAPTTGSESSSGTPWPWIILAAALAAAAGLIGFLVWHRRRSGAAAWGQQTADLNRRALMALDDVVAKGSLATGQIEALAAEARGLEGRAPDDASAAAAAQVRARLDDLAAALESDRALRLGTPGPSQEQLSYSESLIRQQLEQLQGVLRPPGPPEAAG